MIEQRLFACIMSTTSDSDTSSSSSSDSSTSSSDEDNVDVSHTKLGAVEMQTNSPVSEPTPYNSDVRIQTILQAQSAIAPLLKLEALYAQDKKKLVESRLRNGDIPALNTMKCKRLAPFIPDDSIQREKLLDTEYLDEEDAEEQEMARSTADECEADEMETMHMIGEEEAKSEDSDGFDDDAEAVLHEEIMQARKDGMFEFGIDIPTKIIDYPYPDYLIRAAAMMTKENVFGKHPQKFVYCNNLMVRELTLDAGVCLKHHVGYRLVLSNGTSWSVIQYLLKNNSLKKEKKQRPSRLLLRRKSK